MSENEIYDLLIIGGGPGGMTAGIYAMRAALKTAMIESGVPGGQVNLSDEVENWPGIEKIGGSELSAAMHRHAVSYGLEVIQRHVAAVEPGPELHTVRFEDGSTLQTHTVILATGGSPRKLEIPGEEANYGKGVSYCAVCDGFFFRGKTVVVVGGGDSAVEESLYLAKLAEKVYIAHRRDALRAGMLLQKRVEDDCKVEILWNTVLTEIKADLFAGVNEVALQDTVTGENRTLTTDGVFIFVGFVPNTEILPADIRLNAGRYAITDEKCETSVPGIYAVGDLREKYARQIVTAAADGATAALAAAHYVEARKASEDCELPASLKNLN